MYTNSFNKIKNISIKSKPSLDFLYDSSLENSLIDGIDLCKKNNSFSFNLKNQLEKTHSKYFIKNFFFFI